MANILSTGAAVREAPTPRAPLGCFGDGGRVPGSCFWTTPRFPWRVHRQASSWPSSAQHRLASDDLLLDADFVRSPPDAEVALLAPAGAVRVLARPVRHDGGVDRSGAPPDDLDGVAAAVRRVHREGVDPGLVRRKVLEELD